MWEAKVSIDIEFLFGNFDEQKDFGDEEYSPEEDIFNSRPWLKKKAEARDGKKQEGKTEKKLVNNPR